MHYRILIGTPTRGIMCQEFVMSLINMMAYSNSTPFVDSTEQSISFMFSSGSLLIKNRQAIVYRAVQKDLAFTHLLWLDDDMQFPPDTLHRLLAHKLPFVAVNYPSRTLPAQPTARKQTDKGLNDKSCVVYTKEDSTGLEEIDRCGLGITLMSVSALRTVPPPHFLCPWEDDTKTYQGEDWYFCKLFRDKGIKLWIDHDLSKQVKHVGLIGYDHGFVGEVENAN